MSNDSSTVSDLHVATLMTIDDLEELCANQRGCRPSVIVLTPHGSVWELWVDVDDETLRLRSIEGHFGQQVEPMSFSHAFNMLRCGWVIDRRG